MPSPAQPPGEALAIFHDESGDFGHDEWVCMGLLWVPREQVAEFASDLRAARGAFAGEVHFYRFPRNFAGDYGAAARTAQSWFTLWRDVWGTRLWFNVLAIQRRHALYDPRRFGRPEHAYNHFAAEALRAGLDAFFPAPSGDGAHTPFTLAIWSDARAGDHAAATTTAAPYTDFGAQLALAVSSDARATLAPQAVRSLSGARDGPHFTAEQELLQLNDLLLGATATAIAPRTTSATKRWFAREVGRLLRAVRTAPRAGSYALHGHLLVNYFPGHDGRLARDGPLGIWDA